MTDEELIEQIARTVGQKIEGAAEDMDSVWYGAPLWTAYIEEARAILPFIHADREAVRAPLLAEIDRLRGALKLAANRLERNAVDYIAAGDPHSYEQSEWADEARRAALAGDSHDQF